MHTVTVTLAVTDEDLTAGWKGDLTEFAASVRAALCEVQGDDGTAYRPSVETWPAITT